MARDEPAYVEFAGVSKTYDGVTPVVDGLDLEVRRGEFLTLLGPSGSGKTTCLMMLAGFEAPTAGAIRLRGREVTLVPPRKRGIGFVFQRYALFPHLTVAENLAFPLEVRGIRPEARRERVGRALGLVRLEGFGDRRPAELSGGQAQRVAIARALVFEPDLVLMDEPLGALDRRLREEMQYEIRRLQRSLGVTVVYVTHDQQEAMVLSDRIAVFAGGVLQQVSTPEGLYEEPQRTFVARFVGETNELPGVVRQLDPEVPCDVEVSGAIVRALPIAPLEVGSRTTLSIRPERIALSAPPGTHANEFEAEVTDLAFLGDHLRVTARLFGRDGFIVKIPNIVGHGAVLPGDRVRVGWTPTDCRALDAGAAPE